MSDPSPTSPPRTTLNPSTGPIIPRLINAILLRRDFYDAVANDARATGPAAAIVCIVELLSKSVIIHQLSQEFKAWGLLLIFFAILGLVRWLIYATFMYPIARLIIGQPIGYKRLLRCLGFAETPSVLLLLGYLVADVRYHTAVQVVVTVWLLLSTIVAVRSATGASTERAAVIGVIGFVGYLIIGSLTYSGGPPMIEPPSPDDPAALTLRGTL
jgi:hypothetical protein